MDIVDKYKGSRYYSIKNHQEMRDYIRQTIPELIYSEKMLEDLVKIEMAYLVEYKINLKKDVLYSA